jgi:hypothetical protein
MAFVKAEPYGGFAAGGNAHLENELREIANEDGAL